MVEKTVLWMLCFVVGMGVWSVPAQPAKACSCANGFIRHSVLPEKGDTEVDPRATVQFEVAGFSALSTADRLKSGYVLLREKPRQRVPIRHVRLGNFVQLRPLAPLAPHTWYRVQAPKAYGRGHVLLTRFKTYKARPLPGMPAAKLPPAGHCAGPSTGHGRGLCYTSQSVTLAVPRLQFGFGRTAVFHWEVELRIGQRWVAVQGNRVASQGVPLWREHEYLQCVTKRRRRRQPCRRPRTKLLPVNSIQMRSSQCSKGPTVPSGLQSLRLVLVRRDGKRLVGPPQRVFVPN